MFPVHVPSILPAWKAGGWFSLALESPLCSLSYLYLFGSLGRWNKGSTLRTVMKRRWCKPAKLFARERAIINKDEEGWNGGNIIRVWRECFPICYDTFGTHSIATFHQLKVLKCMMSFSFTSKPVSYDVVKVKKVIVLLNLIDAKKLGIGLITQTSPSQLIAWQCEKLDCFNQGMNSSISNPTFTRY
jgi:hypothetical protein